MKGFTLLELLVVVAIVGIITAVALPALTGQPLPTEPQHSIGYESTCK